MHSTEKLMKSTELLFKKLSDATRIVMISQGGLISVNEMQVPECFLIHEGRVVVRRTEDRIILGQLSAPTIFGFNTFQDLRGKVYLEAITPVTFEIVVSSLFFQRIREHQLWEPLLDVMMCTSSSLFAQNHAFTARDSWATVRQHLNQLIQEPEGIRHRVTVTDYILSRTRLSRSGVMKLLAVLRKRQLVKIENGILHAIYSLPKTLN
jgi:CRP-like cAMP-binding protein